MRKNTSPLTGLATLICVVASLLLTIPGQAQPQTLLTRHVRDAVASRVLDVTDFTPAEAA